MKYHPMVKKYFRARFRGDERRVQRILSQNRHSENITPELKKAGTLLYEFGSKLRALDPRTAFSMISFNMQQLKLFYSLLVGWVAYRVDSNTFLYVAYLYAYLSHKCRRKLLRATIELFTHSPSVDLLIVVQALLMKHLKVKSVAYLAILVDCLYDSCEKGVQQLHDSVRRYVQQLRRSFGAGRCVVKHGTGCATSKRYSREMPVYEEKSAYDPTNIELYEQLSCVCVFEWYDHLVAVGERLAFENARYAVCEPSDPWKVQRLF